MNEKFVINILLLVISNVKSFFFSEMKNREDVENEELENFDEAIKAVNTVLQPTKIPESTEKIISDPNCISLRKKSSDFWIMARGLKDFIEKVPFIYYVSTFIAQNLICLPNFSQNLGFFCQNKRISFSTLHFDEIFML